jgi:hypothetical protein
MKLWYQGKNADRLRAYGLGVTAANGYETTYMKTIDRPSENKQPKQRTYRPVNLLGGPVRTGPNRKRKINLL